MIRKFIFGVIAVLAISSAARTTRAGGCLASYTFTPLTLPNVLVNAAYSQSVTVTYTSLFCGSGTADTSIAAGAPPPGITATGNGTVNFTGTPTAVGVSSFTLEGTDGVIGDFADNTYRIDVDFLDVPPSNPFEPFVMKMFANGVTAGCDATHYCPGANILRSQMAVFIMRAVHGSIYVPPAANCATYPFPDVTCPTAFADFILEAFNEGIMGVGEDTACGAGLFCPNHAVTRLSMASILLRGEHGGAYVPPSANCGTFPFLDVTCPSQDADFVAQLVAEGITAGCDATHYCPTASLNRAQMAVFVTVTFNLGF